MTSTWAEQFKTDNSSLISQHAKLTKAMAAHHKRLANYLSEIARLQDHREALLADQALVVAGESDLSSLKFDKDRRDTENTIVVRRADEKCLREEVMPAAESALLQARNKLHAALIAEHDSRSTEIEVVLLAKFEQLVGRYADFLIESERLFVDCDLPFICHEVRLPIALRARMRAFCGESFWESLRQVQAARGQGAAPETPAATTPPQPVRHRKPNLLDPPTETPADPEPVDEQRDEALDEEPAVDDLPVGASANGAEPAGDSLPILDESERASEEPSAVDEPAVEDLLDASTNSREPEDKSVSILDEDEPD